MPILYYASKISDNIAETPEGYLICLNVPIGRSGNLEYLDTEIGIGNKNTLVTVFRPNEENTSPETIASFEGKPVTLEHPNDPVNMNNIKEYIRGYCTNVRIGEGEYTNCLVADLIIIDEELKQKILNKELREVSCGYQTINKIDENTGTILQTNIRGNHIAIVKHGRAGKTVAIRDKKDTALSIKDKAVQKNYFIGAGNMPKTDLESRITGVLRMFGTSTKSVQSENEATALLKDTSTLITDIIKAEVKDAVEEVVEQKVQEALNAKNAEPTVPPSSENVKNEEPTKQPSNTENSDPSQNTQNSSLLEGTTPVEKAILETLADIKNSLCKNAEPTPEQILNNLVGESESLKKEEVVKDPATMNANSSTVEPTMNNSEEVLKNETPVQQSDTVAYLKGIQEAIKNIKDEALKNKIIQDALTKVQNNKFSSSILNRDVKDSNTQSIIEKQAEAYNKCNPHNN